MSFDRRTGAGAETGKCVCATGSRDRRYAVATRILAAATALNTHSNSGHANNPATAFPSTHDCAEIERGCRACGPFRGGATDDRAEHHRDIMDGVENPHADGAGRGREHAGRAMMGPAGWPAIRPSAITVKITALVWAKHSINAAKTSEPTMSTSCGRFRRSARKPPKGTLNTVSQSAMLMAEPACAILQPRSTKSVGPKLNTAAKPT